jgi:hypothetical protein
MQKITLRGQEYPILFDVNVMQQVQKRYDGIEKLGDKLRDFEEMKWIMSTIISEGMEYESYITNQPIKRITPQQAGMLLSWGDFTSGVMSQKVIDAFNESLGNEKNLSAEDLTMLANSMQDLEKTNA